MIIAAVGIKLDIEFTKLQLFSLEGWGGGSGDSPIFWLDRYVTPEKVWYLRVLFFHTESIFPLLVLCSRRYQLVNIQESTGVNFQLHEKKNGPLAELYLRVS